MPPRPARDGPADLLAAIYAQAFERLQVEEGRLLDPANWRKLERLRASQARIVREISTLDRQSQAWVAAEFPGIWRAGGTEFSSLMRDAGVASRFEWTQTHTAGLRAISGDSLKYLLDANANVTDRTRELVRTVVHDETVRKILDGQTPDHEARRIVNELRDTHGITSITTRSGSTMRIDSYAEMVARTQSALAYNSGALTQAVEDRIQWVEVFDGNGCGWSFHLDGDQANGSVRTVEDAAEFPLAHPRCQRAFGPRPDLGLARSRTDLAARAEAGAAKGATPALVGVGDRALAGRRGQILRARELRPSRTNRRSL